MTNIDSTTLEHIEAACSYELWDREDTSQYEDDKLDLSDFDESFPTRGNYN